MLWQNIGRNVITATTYIIIPHYLVMELSDSSTWSIVAIISDISDIELQFY
jgi:hypothetical protein